MHRPLWTYRPLLCMLGLHDTSQRRASTLVVDETYGHGSAATHYGTVHTYGYRVIEECERPMCTYSAEVAPPVAEPIAISGDGSADDPLWVTPLDPVPGTVPRVVRLPDDPIGCARPVPSSQLGHVGSRPESVDREAGAEAPEHPSGPLLIKLPNGLWG